MHIFNTFRGTKGWLWLYERQLQLAHMHAQHEAEQRLRILVFWEKHGEEATTEAFGVSRRTLYRWQGAFRRSGGKLVALDRKSTAPKRRNQRRVPPPLSERIIELRREHPRIGKKKLARLLGDEGYVVSESYIGRVLGDLKERGLLPVYTHLTMDGRTGTLHEKTYVSRQKQRRPVKRGMEVDTVVRFVNGVRRYIVTAIDVERKCSFAAAYTRHSSATAADFLHKLMIVTPVPITEIQTDNGSEFAAHFEDACIALHLTHYHTYPRSPKMNACVERFNRTLDEEFLRYHRALLRDDIAAFNDKLVDWLLWYNAERPHESLGLVSPLRYIVKHLPAEECQMWWTRTFVCIFCLKVYSIFITMKKLPCGHVPQRGFFFFIFAYAQAGS